MKSFLYVCEGVYADEVRVFMRESEGAYADGSEGVYACKTAENHRRSLGV